MQAGAIWPNRATKHPAAGRIATAGRRIRCRLQDTGGNNNEVHGAFACRAPKCRGPIARKQTMRGGRAISSYFLAADRTPLSRFVYSEALCLVGWPAGATTRLRGYGCGNSGTPAGQAKSLGSRPGPARRFDFWMESGVPQKPAVSGRLLRTRDAIFLRAR